MKKSYSTAMFIFLLIPKLIISSDNEQPPARPSSPLVVRARQLTKSLSSGSEFASPRPPAHSPLTVRARQLAGAAYLDDERESPHVVFTKDWMPYSLDFRPRTPPSEEDSRLKVVRKVQMCRRLKMVERALAPQGTINSEARRIGLLRSHNSEEEEEAEDSKKEKRQIAIATAVGVSAIALPTGSAIALFMKNRSMARQNQTKDVAELLNSGGKIISGEWVPSSLKTGLGIGCGVLVIAGVFWGGIALKNKFLEMHRKYQVARRANTLDSRQVREEIETLRRAVLDQNQVLKPVVTEQAKFQTAVVSDIRALKNGNDRVIDCIRGRDGLIEKLTKCEAAFNEAQASVLELDARVQLLEDGTSLGGAIAAPPKPKHKSKFKPLHKKRK